VLVVHNKQQTAGKVKGGDLKKAVEYSDLEFSVWNLGFRV
jgi:hypothetical protein